MRIFLQVIASFLFSLVSPSAWAATGDPACAKAPSTLRRGPGGSFAVSWKVARHMPFLKMESKSGWVKVQDLDGEQHWAASRDLSSAYNCVVVKSSVATLRQEPSTGAPPVDLKTLDRYTPLKKIESQGEWIKVEYDAGQQAWIHESNVWKPVKISTVNF